MAQTIITDRVNELLALGTTEAEIEATGAVNEYGEWHTYNRRELTAFETLEAITKDPRPKGVFAEITLSNGETVWGAQLPQGVEAFDEAIITRKDGGRKVVLIGEKHHDTEDGAVYYLASSKTETDIAPAPKPAPVLNREDRALAAFSDHMAEQRILNRRQYRKANFDTFRAAFLEDEAKDAPQVSFYLGMASTGSNHPIALAFATKWNSKESGGGDAVEEWLKGEGYILEKIETDLDPFNADYRIVPA